MIITHIIGGLGNQMFQYAAGRALTIAKEVSLLLDVSDLDQYPLHHGFELSRVFPITAEVATREDLRQLLGWRAHSLAFRILCRKPLSRFRRRSLVIEPHFNYWDSIRDVPEDCYIRGYWQSEKYFENIAGIIRRDFDFSSPMGSANQESAKRINSCNSVSLHVRRGDFARESKTLSIHGLCSIDYYHRAIACITENIKDPEFFVFSDDMRWARTHLRIAHPIHYMQGNLGVDSFKDMRLMALCRHHVIANSSFSWWGAWLNPNQKKIVVAPKQWFATEQNTNDLLPRDWIRL